MPCKVIDLQTRQECKRAEPEMVPKQYYLDACGYAEYWAEKFRALMEEKKAWIDERCGLELKIADLNFGLSVALDPNSSRDDLEFAEPIWEENRQWLTSGQTSVG